MSVPKHVIVFSNALDHGHSIQSVGHKRGNRVVVSDEDHQNFLAKELMFTLVDEENWTDGEKAQINGAANKQEIARLQVALADATAENAAAGGVAAALQHKIGEVQATETAIEAQKDEVKRQKQELVLQHAAIKQLGEDLAAQQDAFQKANDAYDCALEDTPDGDHYDLAEAARTARVYAAKIKKAHAEARENVEKGAEAFRNAKAALKQLPMPEQSSQTLTQRLGEAIAVEKVALATLQRIEAELHAAQSASAAAADAAANAAANASLDADEPDSDNGIPDLLLTATGAATTAATTAASAAASASANGKSEKGKPGKNMGKSGKNTHWGQKQSVSPEAFMKLVGNLVSQYHCEFKGSEPNSAAVLAARAVLNAHQVAKLRTKA